MSEWLEIGSKAPAFSLMSDSGKKVKLSDYQGQPVVLYFYPKDDTPGCTKQACAFRDASTQMKDLGAVVLGVSPDSHDSHAKFRDKFSLNFPLLADLDHKLADEYAASGKAIAGIVAGVDGNFGTETQKLGQNISALNNVYELQLKSSQDYLNSIGQMNQLQDSIKGVMNDLASSAQDTQIYRENMSMLSKNLTELNTVYGNMLKALKG